MSRTSARSRLWGAAAGTAALIALPVFAAAQTSGSQTSGTTPQSGTAQQSQQTSDTPSEHLSEARQTLDSIPRASIAGANASKISDVKRHFDALEKSYSGSAAGDPSAPSSSASSSASQGDWNSHLIALERSLSDLLSDSSSSSTPGAVGTSGSEQGRSVSGSAPLESDVRAKLEEFQAHVKKFKSAAGGSASSSMSDDPSSSSPTASGASTMPTEQTQTTSSQSSSQSQPPASSSPPSSQADASAPPREHLTKARQSLADLTAMPQAQQLQGETRNQVSQLISQFNQLITTQDDWRAAYNEVNGTLTALLSGSAGAGTSSSGTSGSVGTSGSAASGASASGSLDPGIRGKLEEFRTHLQAFHSAAGGDEAGSASSTGAQTSSGTSTSGMSTASGSSSEAETHIAAIERILNEASGGSGTASSSTTGSPATSTTGSTTGTSSSSTSGTTASGTSGTTGTPSTSSAAGSASGAVTLDSAKLQEIRMHLQQLRQSIKQ
jgi:hypothetical protein